MTRSAWPVSEPPGEKLIKYACIVNDSGRAAGRCGLGALMGSKNLKAVAAAGNLKPEQADAGKVGELAKQAIKDINGNLVSVAFREYGTLMYSDMAMVLGGYAGEVLYQKRFSGEQSHGPDPAADVFSWQLCLPRLPHRLRTETKRFQTGSRC